MSLSFVKGTDVTINITFTKNGSPFNITGYTLLFTVKTPDEIDVADTSAVIRKNIVAHTDPVNGKSAIVLSNTETDIAVGKYYWDIRLLNAGVLSSTVFDHLDVIQNITIRKTAV